MGLSPNSRVLDVYRHLTGEDVRNAVLDMHGLQPKELKEEKAQIRQCPICHAINTEAAMTCISCHRPLTVEAVLDLEARSKQFLVDVMEILTHNPEEFEKLKKFLTKK